MNRCVTLFLVSAALALGLPVDMSALAAADLTVQLSRVGAGPVFTGSKIKFVVDIFNRGASDADNVSVDTKLPSAWSFVQAGQPGCTIVTTPVLPHLGPGDVAEHALCAVGIVPAHESKKLYLSCEGADGLDRMALLVVTSSSRGASPSLRLRRSRHRVNGATSPPSRPRCKPVPISSPNGPRARLRR